MSELPLSLKAGHAWPKYRKIVGRTDSPKNHSTIVRIQTRVDSAQVDLPRRVREATAMRARDEWRRWPHASPVRAVLVYRCAVCRLDFYSRWHKIEHEKHYHPFGPGCIACHRCGQQFADYETSMSHIKRKKKLCLTTLKTAPKDQPSVPSTSSPAIVADGLPSLPNEKEREGDATTTTSPDCRTSDGLSLDMRHLTDESGTPIPNRSTVISPLLECRYCAKRFAKSVNLRAHEKIKHRDGSATLPAIGVIKDEPGEMDTFVCANSAPVKLEVKQESSDFGQ